MRIPARTRTAALMAALLTLATTTAAPRAHAQGQQSGSGDAKPCDVTERSSQVVVTLSHRDVKKTHVCTVRLNAKRTVLVHIDDANPLLYSYAVTATEVQADPAQAAFRTLLNVRNVAAEPVVRANDTTAVKAADTLGVRAATEFASAILVLGGQLLDLVRDSDWTDGKSAAVVERQVRDDFKGALERSKLDLFVYSERVMLTRLDALVAAVTNPQKRTELEPLVAAARAAIPGVVQLTSALRTLHLGDKWLEYEYTGGDRLLEITITNRMGDAHSPRRLVGKDIDLAELKPAARAFLFSVGLAGLTGNRITHSLTPIPAATPPAGQAAAPDTYQVAADTVRRLAVVPSAFLTLQRPLRWGSAVTYGGTIGVGVRGSSLEQIDNTTDLSLLGTIGYEWARLSLGAAYTSEVVGLTGVGADGKTTDPNVLARAARDRKVRFIFALHAAP